MKRKRLKALIKEIQKHPERHNQGAWINGLEDRNYTWDSTAKTHVPERTKEYEGQLINCGTTGCLAGLGSLRYAPVGTKFWGDYLELPDNTVHSYAEYGREVLGLDGYESGYLFSAYRTMDEIIAFSDMKKVQRRSVALG